MIDKIAVSRRVLLALYEHWDRLNAAESWACGPGCAACCTDRVLVGRVELNLMLETAAGTQMAARWEALRQSRVDPGTRPATTPNQLAGICMQGREPPPDNVPAREPGVCPFLGGGGRCAVYEHRPMACRVMLSRRRCAPGGAATLDEWRVTLGLVFCQLAEQLSAGGAYGLLPDVLAHAEGRPAQVLTCANLAGLPVPPEHAERVQRMLGAMMSAPSDQGLPLGHWFNVLRA